MPSAFRAFEISVLHGPCRDKWIRLVLNQILTGRNVYDVGNVVIRTFPRVETLGIIDIQHLKQLFDRPVGLRSVGMRRDAKANFQSGHTFRAACSQSCGAPHSSSVTTSAPQ